MSWLVSKIWTLFLVVILACSTTVCAIADDLIWGANGHPFSAYSGVTTKEQVGFLKDIGFTYYRVDVRYKSDANALANLISEARTRGITILPVITPVFDLKKESVEDIHRKAFDLARTLAARFKEDIRVWELGNEEENFAIIQPCEMRDDGTQYNCKWGPAGGDNVLDYYGPRWAKVSALLKGLSEGVMDVDPTIRKAIGTAGWGHKAAFDRMQQDGLQWDISVWHSYGPDLEYGFKHLVKFGKPIWLTEFNHAGGSQRSEADQSKGIREIVQTARRLRKKYNVEAAFVYELFDEPYWAPNYEAYMGLVRLIKNKDNKWRPGAPKQAFYTLQNLIHNWKPDEDEAAKSAPKDAAAKADPGTRVSSLKGLRDNCELSQFQQFDTSPKNQVAYAYCLILDRDPDGGGMDGWVKALSENMKIRRMLYLMLTTDEFAEKHKLKEMGSAEYVTLLYRLLLDRDPDGTELMKHLAALNSGAPREDIVNTVLDSKEARLLHHVFFPVGQDVQPK